jgi:thioredoxin 1
MGDEVILTEATFDEEVLKSDVPVLIDFWAEWCAPCKTLGPTIEEIAAAYKGRAKVAKINVDQNPGLAQKYGIRSIPAIILVSNGEVADQLIGVQSKETLAAMIDKILA